MRKLAFHMITSADGIFSSEYSSVNPDTQWDEEVARFYVNLFTKSGGIVFGRKLYDQYWGHWSRVASGEIPPETELELRWTQRMMEMPKYVISHSEPVAYGGETQGISGDVVTAIRQLKESPGTDLLLMCGPSLLAELNRNRLIDEYMLYVCPNFLGHGRHLFAEIDEPVHLRVAQIVQFASGMTLTRYHPLS